MDLELRADADIHGHSIRLSLVYRGTERIPRLHLVRRQRAFPTGPRDGVPVLDLADLFDADRDSPWERIEATKYLVPKTPADLQRPVLAEHGLLQAEVAAYYRADRDDTTARVRIRWYDVDADEERERLEAAIPVEFDPGEFDRVELHTTCRLLSGATDEVFPLEMKTEQAVLDPAATSEPPTIELRRLHVEGSYSDDTGQWQLHIELDDTQLESESTYYYALFIPDTTTGSGFRGAPQWRAMAMATGRYGLDDRLYQLLPALHQQYDEPSRPDNGTGQLRRFLQVFGASCDQFRSLAESLRGRHDLFAARVDLLLHLARGIGWEPDRTVDAETLRRDILFAPELFSTVGTLPNIRALVARAAGWDCRVKEFVHNIFLTNAPEPIHLWEIWGQRNDGHTWSVAEALTRTDALDGRPALAVDRNDVTWLFWHSGRSGRRELWMQPLDGAEEPRRVMQGAPDDRPHADYSDEYPAVVPDGNRLRLFWCSNRDGHWNIYTRTIDTVGRRVIGGPEALTDHPAEDRNPAAVIDGGGRLWLFWQSNRRGPTDIWNRVRERGRGDTLPSWSAPMRLTDALRHHQMPAAVRDSNGNIWLFWSDDGGQGCKLYYQVHDRDAWSEPKVVAESPSHPWALSPRRAYRDEAPSVVFWEHRLWLFFHSNRSGRWRICGGPYRRGRWDVSQLTDHPTADKEPAAVVDAASELRIVWRSQRRGVQYRSRTIDTRDTEALAEMKTIHDRSHYTYDTGTDPDDWYAWGAVGLYVTPTDTDAERIGQEIERTTDFLDPFRPLPVRFVWPTGADAHEVIDVDELLTDSFVDTT